MAGGGHNMFAVTCELLRQYMREHKNQPQTGGRAAPFMVTTPQLHEEEETDARTMQLFPTYAETSQPSHKRPGEQARPAPLTIIYDGRVLVFEDFPADKAKELMQLAGLGSSSALKNEVPVLPKKPVANEPSSSASDMPIARKASLKRFLQKRKDRIITVDPYNMDTKLGKEAAVSKPVKCEPSASWLAL